MDYSLTGGEAAAVVVSAIGMYAGVLLLLRVAGRRLVSGLSAYDLAGGIALGALIGRTVLGYTPTLPAGLLGLVTLGLLHAGSLALARTPAGERLLGAGPVLLIRDGRVVPDALRRARLRESDLHCALRRAGVGGYTGVAAAVLERSGSISVVRENPASSEALNDLVTG